MDIMDVHEQDAKFFRSVVYNRSIELLELNLN